MFASDNQHCLDGKYDVCFFKCIHDFILFWSSSMILKKASFRISASSVNADSINQISKSDAIVILGSSLSVLAYTYSDSFGLMRWKQKCTLWLLYLYLYFWLGLRWEQ
jgi:hypothetical protein